MSAEKSKKEQERLKREEEKLERIRQKEAERVRKEEEKRRREEERLRKEAEKEQERLRKEEEKRKKDEEREQDRLRKEEEKRKKEEERIRKEEEKRKKDEEREQERLRKEEEKRRKDEEKEQERVKREEEKRKREEDKEQERLKKKLKLDEQEQKAKRQAEFMQSFLKKTPLPSTSSADVSMELDSPETPKFRAMPFQVKSGMALAPLHRRPPPFLNLVRKELFSSTTDEESPSFEPYLEEVKKRGGRKSCRTQVVKEVDEDIEIIDPKVVIDNPAEAGLIKWRWKLLQFHRNVRPPYWGTWKRKPGRVRGRAPFARESEVDYDFDSDDEWEEEPEDGEDLGDKDDADKEEDEKCSTAGAAGEEEEEDEEDDFLVPHGYLSDDEGGVAEYRDKDTLKTLEEEFYRDLKRENINGFPIIETDNLDQYTMIFCPDDENESDIGDDTEDEEDGGEVGVVGMKVKVIKAEGGVGVAGA